MTNMPNIVTNVRAEKPIVLELICFSNNITFCIERKYIYIYIYIIFSNRLWFAPTSPECRLVRDVINNR